MTVKELKTKTEFDKFLRDNELVVVDFYLDDVGPSSIPKTALYDDIDDRSIDDIKFAQVYSNSTNVLFIYKLLNTYDIIGQFRR